tara:strand:+ start:852 stop:1019 length:168 start_codon:yes stop_codon:yes gene_type:complete
MEKTEVFAYLDTLRESGQINMMGASSYLVQAFDVTKREARELLSEWMQLDKFKRD